MANGKTAQMLKVDAGEVFGRVVERANIWTTNVEEDAELACVPSLSQIAINRIWTSLLSRDTRT